jgi:hypothetical protein
MYEIKVYGVPTEPADTTAPATAANLTAIRGDSKIYLDWDDNTDSDLFYYSAYRSTTAGGPYTLVADYIAASDYTDTGVTNGTPYYYVVSTTDENYNESGDSNEASATPITLSNLALNKPVVVDSILNSSYPGENAVDGNNSDNASRWVSANTVWPHWIEVDLQGTYSISELKFWTGYDGYETPPTNFQFQQWDGANWVDIFSETGNSNPEYSKVFAPVTTSKVRLYGTSGQDNYFKLYEIEVYGAQGYAGDLNSDNKVDMQDMAELARGWQNPYDVNVLMM